MKKILTLMLALACALFVGVSCTKDSADGKKPKEAITFEYLGILSHEQGNYKLNYTVNVEMTDFSKLVLSKPSSDWLKVSLPLTDDNYVNVSVLENKADPGTPAREDSFTVTLDNHPSVTVVVKQGSYGVDFEFHFIENTKSCNYAQCYCEPKDNDLKYVAVSSSQLADKGVTGSTPAAQLKNYVERLAKEGVLEKSNEGYWFQGSSEEFPMDAFRVTPEDEVYVYAVGFEATPTGQSAYDPDLDVEYQVYKVDLVTPVNKEVVPFLPYPTFEVAQDDMTKKVSCEKATFDVDCKVLNPMANGVVDCKTDANWLSASWNNDKLTLTCEANISAIGRSATMSVRYGEKKESAIGKELFDVYAEVEFTVRQDNDPNAEAPKYEIVLTETKFHKLVIDVTTDDPNVQYVVDCTLESNLSDSKTLATLAQNRVADAVQWGDKQESYRLTTYSGNRNGHVVKLNVNNYENASTRNYKVFVYPVDLESMTVLADPTSIDATIGEDIKRPTLQWVKSDRLIKQEGKDFYEFHAKAGETVTLQYELTNPVEEGVVDVLNRAYLKNVMYIIENEEFVFDQEKQTVTFTVRSDYDACSSHWFEFNLTYKDKDDANWNWNTQSGDLKVFQEK